jgi:hypothetical protein
LVPQLLVGVPRSAQQVSAADAQVPWLHHDVIALRPAIEHGQHTGAQSSGWAQVDPTAPIFQGKICCAPAHEKNSLALAIESTSVMVALPPPHSMDPAASAGASPNGPSCGKPPPLQFRRPANNKANHARTMAPI